MNLSIASFSKLGIVGLPVVMAALLTPAAKAEYPCSFAGPGEIVVGQTQAGGGIASVLLCDTDPNYQNASNNQGNGGSSYYDPELAALEFQNANALLGLQQQLDLLQDPTYLRYLSGSWSFFPTTASEDAASGEYCVASFFKASMDPDANDAPVMINLSGPGGDYEGALLSFATEAIPKPDTMRMISVTLTQNNYPPATVQAFNYSVPDLPFGMIAFAVPTIEAALDGMEDVQSFDVSIAGRSVANTTWHSGLSVRDEFRRCLNDQPYLVTGIDIVPDRLKTQIVKDR
ncbi:MAG: hypothetical protein WA885_04500 [Phormidesmis sp.]